MSDITDPEAIRFTNEVIRPAADKLSGFYYFAEMVVDQFNAKPDMFDRIIKGDDLKDGADVDGRPPLTGDQLKTIFTILTDFAADFRDSGKLNTINSAAVNPRF